MVTRFVNSVILSKIRSDNSSQIYILPAANTDSFICVCNS